MDMASPFFCALEELLEECLVIVLQDGFEGANPGVAKAKSADCRKTGKAK
ncbi:unnamed protein product [marine sediment metagenome]|uniref:Uncharacterized protein n=1 Tax=marine sediment metagenome TaxID=412755 RepID=X1SCE9_9ZZZZ